MIRILKILYGVQDYRHKRIKVVTQKLRGLDWNLRQLYRHWFNYNLVEASKEESDIIIKASYWNKVLQNLRNENHG